MSQIKTPIGHIIFSSYQTPGNLKDNFLQNSLEELVAVIKQHITTKGLLEAYTIVEDDLFNIRFDLLDYILKNPHFIDELENSIIGEIGNRYFEGGKYPKISRAVSDTLDVYLIMFGKLAEDMAKNIGSLEPLPKNIKTEFTLSLLRRAHKLQPNPELKRVIDWYESSIKYDFYLIVAELLIANDVFLPTEEVTLLPQHLKHAIIDFGTYTALTGVWNPAIENESQLLRNIKIKTAALSLQAGLGKPVPFDALYNLLH